LDDGGKLVGQNAEKNVKSGGIMRLVFLMLLSMMSTIALAQYKSAIGARLGGTTGGSLKQFLIRPIYGELLVGSFENGFSVTALVKKQKALAGNKNFFIYHGGGVHLAFYNGEDVINTSFGRKVRYESGNDMAIGVDFILGVEYKLPANLPFVVYADLKPFVEFGTGGYVVFAPDPSIGFKFIVR
jgi:hypothetical protein